MGSFFIHAEWMMILWVKPTTCQYKVLITDKGVPHEIESEGFRMLTLLTKGLDMNFNKRDNVNVFETQFHIMILYPEMRK